MHDLVYVKYNQQLKRRQDIRDEIDPISLNDIDECNEWLVGEMDEDDDAGNELVFDDDNTLNWATVYEASGVGEPRVYTRRKTQKRKQSSRGVKAAQTSKKHQAKASTSKGKEIVVEDVEEVEFEDFDEEFEEEGLVNVNVEESEGEEEEGHAPLDDDIDNEDDYVGVEEED